MKLKFNTSSSSFFFFLIIKYFIYYLFTYYYLQFLTALPRLRGCLGNAYTPTLWYPYRWGPDHVRGTRGSNHLKRAPRAVLAPPACKEQRFVDKGVGQMETDTSLQYKKGWGRRRSLSRADERRFFKLIFSLFYWPGHRLFWLLQWLKVLHKDLAGEQ